MVFDFKEIIMFKNYHERNRLVYLESLRVHREGHRAVNWGSEASQQKRFDVLTKIADDVFESSILDIGCGIGHLVDFILARGFSGTYLGIDLLEEMIVKAQSRHPKMSFENNSIQDYKEKSFDYVFMSGIFTVANEEALKFLIMEAFRIGKKGVAFNTLSAWANEKDPDEYYAEPGKILEFCFTLTSKIVLRHDYLPHDFTVYLYNS